MAIDLLRAARIGLLPEVIVQLISARASNGQARISAAEVGQLRAAMNAISNQDVVLAAMSLIGESDIVDAIETEEGGVLFIVACNDHNVVLPTTIVQALRQHGISEARGNELYTQCHSIADLDEQTFVRFCLRESSQKAAHPITRHWQPSQFCRAGLKKRGAGDHFIDDLIPEFILIFNEKPRAVLSFDLEFFRFAAVRWQRFANAFDESTDLRALPERWQPSAQTVKYLASCGVPAHAIEKLLPTFRLAAHERSEVQRNWGAQFIKFCLAKKGNRE